MGYDKEKLEKEALKVIKEKHLIFINEVVTYLPCNRATFYNKGLDKLDTIVNALDKNKVHEKVKLRKKWRHGDNAALNMALYKLCSTDEEAAKLNPSKSETTVNVFNEGKDEDLTKLSTDELKRRIAAAEKGSEKEGD